MNWLTKLGRRLRFVLREDEVEQELSDEIRHHVEMEAEELVRTGWDPAKARAEARRRFGGEGPTRERVRDQRGGRLLGDLVQDVRYGLRILRRAPAFASMSVATLAIGIGATTAIFSLVYAVLLTPLPYAQPDRLVRLWETSPQGSDRSVVSPGNLVDWQERARSFTAVGAYGGPYLEQLTGDGDPARVSNATVQPEVLRALAVTPVLGRSFTDDDGVTADVALISHALWESRYGADPGILGRTLFTSDGSYAVVGVMPPGFFFPEEGVDMLVPVNRMAVDPTNRAGRLFKVVARLAPDVTIETAQAEMAAIADQLVAEYPAEMAGWSVNVVPLHADMTRDVTSLFWLLLGAVAVVLLITCANVSNLLLARAVSRHSEIAMRRALGAGRGRILQQLLIESVVLAALGCGGAVLLAPVILEILTRAAPADIPFLSLATIDGRMLAFAATAGALCALLFGLAPALRLVRSTSATVLREARGASTHGHAYLRGTLLTGQVALSVMLLVGAALFVRSFGELRAAELGFDPVALLQVDVDFLREERPELPAQFAFYDALLDSVGRVPGVIAVAGSTQPPGSRGLWVTSFAIEGRAAANPNGREDPELVHAVSLGYFDTMDQRLVRGRAFNVADRADGLPVVIVNESFARKYFPSGEAIGQRITLSPFFGATDPLREIVGVIEDTRLESPDVEPRPGLFIPLAQKTSSWMTWMTIVVRVREAGVDQLAIANELRTALREFDAGLLVWSEIQSVEGVFRVNTARRTFAMTLVSGFAVIALILVVTGLYGLISYSVAREHREIGVRIALGAHRWTIVGRVVRRSLTLTVVGIAGGLLAAALASRVVSTLLYEVSPLDGASYALAGALVLMAVLITAAIPGLRAAGMSPLPAIRSD